jgi:hypothetical protein
MKISEKIRLLFSEEMLTRADKLYSESADCNFHEKAIEFVRPLLPLGPGVNVAAGLGESDLDYLAGVLELAVAVRELSKN